MVLSHCILYKDREKELSGEAALRKSPEEIEIRHGGIGKFFGTLISFFRSFISFFRSLISFFRSFIALLGVEFFISSVGDLHFLRRFFPCSFTAKLFFPIFVEDTMR